MLQWAVPGSTRPAGNAPMSGRSCVARASWSTPGQPVPLQTEQLPEAVTGTVSLYATSDLHTDYAANLAWVQHLDSRRCEAGNNTSVLIVAGDISDDMGLLRNTLEALTSKFNAVAFVPGNHELWVKGSPKGSACRNGGATDSIAKLHKVLQLCADLGVITQPTQIGGLVLVPLLAWHHQSFDKEADIVGIPRASAMTIGDYAACKWPEDFPGAGLLGSVDTAAWFDAANEDLQQPGWHKLQQVLQQRGSAGPAGAPDMVTFSHFLPHQHLLPEKRMLSYPNLAKAVGSDYLWQRLQHLQPDMHVFGHSHFAWDLEVAGIRCVQAPLCYPAERLHRLKSVILHNTPQQLEAQLQHHHQQQSQAEHRNSSSSSSSSTSTDPSSSSRISSSRISGSSRGQQQPHRLHIGLQDHVGWLPVKLYEAAYTADLQQLPSQRDGDGKRQGVCADQYTLTRAGVPVLHTMQLKQQAAQLADSRHGSQLKQQAAQLAGSQQQGQLGADATISSQAGSSSSSSSYCYAISSWQGSWCGNLGGMWSDYYKATAREPNNVELAPWVVKRYSKYKRLSAKLKGGSRW